MTLEYQFRPLGTWLEPTTANRRGAHLFRTTWTDTLDLLSRELDHLGASRVVLQVDVAPGGIRRDGQLRADARAGFPGVRLSFVSRHGPLTYASDAYERQWAGSRVLESWQANVRAIALGLEALRAVDRYGVSGRGEQYRGWTAISSMPASMTLDEAAEIVAAGSGLAVTAQGIIRDPQTREAAFRAAARRLHPDGGGDPAGFASLTEARALIERAVDV